MALRLSQVDDEGQPRRPLVRAATIRTTADDTTDLLYVTIDSDSQTALRGPCRGWQSRGSLFPEAGDKAAVVELDDGTLWIVAWGTGGDFGGVPGDGDIDGGGA